MAGLLGDSWEDPRMMATLQMAAGLLSGGNFGQAMGRGLSGYSQTMQAAKEAEYQKMLVDAKREEIAAAQRQRAEQQRIQQVIRQAVQPVTGTQAIGVDGRGPTADKVPMIGQLPRLNPNALIAQGVPVDTVKQLMDAQNFGRPKVARTLKGIGPDGKEYEYQVDEFGQRIGDGFAQYRAPIQSDQGGKQVFLDPYKLSPVASFDKTMTPGERASNQLGWANNAISRGNLQVSQDRLKLDQGQNGFTFNADLGGYVPKAPGGEFIPLQGVNKSPKLTESEGKNTLYLSQMLEASKALEGLQSSPAMVAATNSPFTNWLAGDDSQKAAQAQRQWAEAYLRAKTGAAATAGEVDNNIRTFFPVVGDSASTIKRKAEARKAAEMDMTIPAGRGADRVKRDPAPMEQMPPAAQHKGKTIRDTTTGKLLKSDGMTWKEVQ